MLKKLNGIVLVLLLLTACAGFQQRTPDEQARIILDQAQEQLNIWFDSTKIYVEMNPQYQPIWKEKILPAFKIANDTVLSTMILYQKGKITSQDVESIIRPKINEILIYLIQIGVIK